MCFNILKGVSDMSDLLNVDQYLDPESLTWGTVLVAFLTILVAVLLGGWLRRQIRTSLESRDGIEQHTAALAGRMTGWAVTLIGIIAAMAIVGVEAGPLVLLLLIFGAMALISGRDVVANFAAGLSLQFTTPFVVGDRIEIAGVTGWVEAITARAVVLTTRDRRTMYVPNSMVIQSVLFNYTDDEQRRSEVAFSVAYGSDLGLTREITVDAVSEIEMIHAHPAPVAYVDALGGDGIDMEMRFYHDDADRIAVRDAVAEAILVALEGTAIDLSTPEIIVQKADTHQ